MGEGIVSFFFVIWLVAYLFSPSEKTLNAIEKKTRLKRYVPPADLEERESEDMYYCIYCEQFHLWGDHVRSKNQKQNGRHR